MNQKNDFNDDHLQDVNVMDSSIESDAITDFHFKRGKAGLTQSNNKKITSTSVQRNDGEVKVEVNAKNNPTSAVVNDQGVSIQREDVTIEITGDSSERSMRIKTPRKYAKVNVKHDGDQYVENKFSSVTEDDHDNVIFTLSNKTSNLSDNYSLLVDKSWNLLKSTNPIVIGDAVLDNVEHYFIPNAKNHEAAEKIYYKEGTGEDTLFYQIFKNFDGINTSELVFFKPKVLTIGGHEIPNIHVLYQYVDGEFIESDRLYQLNSNINNLSAEAPLQDQRHELFREIFKNQEDDEDFSEGYHYYASNKDDIDEDESEEDGHSEGAHEHHTGYAYQKVAFNGELQKMPDDSEVYHKIHTSGQYYPIFEFDGAKVAFEKHNVGTNLYVRYDYNPVTKRLVMNKIQNHYYQDGETYTQIATQGNVIERHPREMIGEDGNIQNVTHLGFFKTFKNVSEFYRFVDAENTVHEDLVNFYFYDSDSDSYQLIDGDLPEAWKVDSDFVLYKVDDKFGYYEASDDDNLAAKGVFKFTRLTDTTDSNQYYKDNDGVYHKIEFAKTGASELLIQNDRVGYFVDEELDGVYIFVAFNTSDGSEDEDVDGNYYFKNVADDNTVSYEAITLPSDWDADNQKLLKIGSKLGFFTSDDDIQYSNTLFKFAELNTENGNVTIKEDYIYFNDSQGTTLNDHAKIVKTDDGNKIAVTVDELEMRGSNVGRYLSCNNELFKFEMLRDASENRSSSADHKWEVTFHNEDPESKTFYYKDDSNVYHKLKFNFSLLDSSYVYEDMGQRFAFIDSKTGVEDALYDKYLISGTGRVTKINDSDTIFFKESDGETFTSLKIALGTSANKWNVNSDNAIRIGDKYGTLRPASDDLRDLGVKSQFYEINGNTDGSVNLIENVWYDVNGAELTALNGKTLVVEDFEGTNAVVYYQEDNNDNVYYRYKVNSSNDGATKVLDDNDNPETYYYNSSTEAYEIAVLPTDEDNSVTWDSTTERLVSATEFSRNVGVDENEATAYTKLLLTNYSDDYTEFYSDQDAENRITDDEVLVLNPTGAYRGYTLDSNGDVSGHKFFADDAKTMEMTTWWQNDVALNLMEKTQDDEGNDVYNYVRKTDKNVFHKGVTTDGSQNDVENTYYSDVDATVRIGGAWDDDRRFVESTAHYVFKDPTQAWRKGFFIKGNGTSLTLDDDNESFVYQVNDNVYMRGAYELDTIHNVKVFKSWTCAYDTAENALAGGESGKLQATVGDVAYDLNFYNKDLNIIGHDNQIDYNVLNSASSDSYKNIIFKKVTDLSKVFTVNTQSAAAADAAPVFELRHINADGTTAQNVSLASQTAAEWSAVGAMSFTKDLAPFFNNLRLDFDGAKLKTKVSVDGHSSAFTEAITYFVTDAVQISLDGWTADHKLLSTTSYTLELSDGLYRKGTVSALGELSDDDNKRYLDRDGDTEITDWDVSVHKYLGSNIYTERNANDGTYTKGLVAEDGSSMTKDEDNKVYVDDDATVEFDITTNSVTWDEDSNILLSTTRYLAKDTTTGAYFHGTVDDEGTASESIADEYTNSQGDILVDFDSASRYVSDTEIYRNKPNFGDAWAMGSKDNDITSKIDGADAWMNGQLGSFAFNGIYSTQQAAIEKDETAQLKITLLDVEYALNRYDPVSQLLYHDSKLTGDLVKSNGSATTEYVVGKHKDSLTENKIIVLTEAAKNTFVPGNTSWLTIETYASDNSLADEKYLYDNIDTTNITDKVPALLTAYNQSGEAITNFNMLTDRYVSDDAVYRLDSSTNAYKKNNLDHDGTDDTFYYATSDLTKLESFGANDYYEDDDNVYRSDSTTGAYVKNNVANSLDADDVYYTTDSSRTAITEFDSNDRILSDNTTVLRYDTTTKAYHKNNVAKDESNPSTSYFTDTGLEIQSPFDANYRLLKLLSGDYKYTKFDDNTKATIRGDIDSDTGVLTEEGYFFKLNSNEQLVEMSSWDKTIHTLDEDADTYEFDHTTYDGLREVGDLTATGAFENPNKIIDASDREVVLVNSNAEYIRELAPNLWERGPINEPAAGQTLKTLGDATSYYSTKALATAGNAVGDTYEGIVHISDDFTSYVKKFTVATKNLWTNGVASQDETTENVTLGALSKKYYDSLDKAIADVDNTEIETVDNIDIPQTENSILYNGKIIHKLSDSADIYGIFENTANDGETPVLGDAQSFYRTRDDAKNAVDNNNTANAIQAAGNMFTKFNAADNVMFVPGYYDRSIKIDDLNTLYMYDSNNNRINISDIDLNTNQSSNSRSVAYDASDPIHVMVKKVGDSQMTSDSPSFDPTNPVSSKGFAFKLNSSPIANETFWAMLNIKEDGNLVEEIKDYYTSENNAKTETNPLSLTTDKGDVVAKLSDVAGQEVWATFEISGTDLPRSIDKYYSSEDDAIAENNALSHSHSNANPYVMLDLGTALGNQVYGKVVLSSADPQTTVTSYHTAETPTDANKFSTVTGDDNTNSHVIFDLGSKGGKHISVKVPLASDDSLDTSDADNYEYYFGSDAATANTAAKNGTAANKLETVDDVVIPARSELHNGYIIHQMKAGVDIYGVYTNTAAGGADPVMGGCKGFYVGKAAAQSDAASGSFGNRIKIGGDLLTYYDATNEFLHGNASGGGLYAISLNDLGKVYFLGGNIKYVESSVSLTNGGHSFSWDNDITYSGSAFHNQLQNVKSSRSDDTPTFDSGTTASSNDLVIKLNDTAVAGTTFYATLTVDDTSGEISDDIKAYYASEDDAKAESNSISTDDNGNIIMKLADVAGEEVWAKIAVDSSDVPTSITSYHTDKTEAESGTNALTATDGVVMIDLGTAFGTQVYAKVESTSGVLNSTVTSYHTAETPTDANKFSTVTGDDNTDSHVIFDLGSKAGKHISVKVPLASDNTLDTSDADNYEYYFGSDAATANTAAKNGTAANKLETVGIEGRSELHNGYIIHQMKAGVDIYGVYTNTADAANPVMGDCKGFYVGKTQAQNDAIASDFGNRINFNGVVLLSYDATHEFLHDNAFDWSMLHSISLNDLSKVYVLNSSNYYEAPVSLTNGNNNLSVSTASSYTGSTFDNQLQSVRSRLDDKPTFDAGTNNASSNDLVIKLNDTQVAGTTFYATLTVDDTSGVISDDVKAYYASEDDAKAEENAISTDDNGNIIMKLADVAGEEVWAKIAVDSNDVPTSITSYHTDKTEAESGTNALTATDGVIMFDLGTVFGTQVYAKIESTSGALNSTITSYHTAETPTDANKISVSPAVGTATHIVLPLDETVAGKNVAVRVPLDSSKVPDISDVNDYDYYYDTSSANAISKAVTQNVAHDLEDVTNASSNDLVIKLNDTQVAGTTFYATLTVDDTSGVISDDIKAYYKSEDDAKAEENAISTDDNGNIIMKLADVAGEEVWAKIAVDSNDVPTSITSYHTGKTEAESGTNALTLLDSNNSLMLDFAVFGTTAYARVSLTSGVPDILSSYYKTNNSIDNDNELSTVTDADGTISHVIFDLGSRGGKHISVKAPLASDKSVDTSDADNYEYYFGSDAATANTAAKNGTAGNKLETVDDVVVTPGRSELHNGYIIHQMKAGVDIYGVYTNTAADGADPVMGDCKGFYVGKTQAQNDATAENFGNRININGSSLTYYDAANEFLHNDDSTLLGAMSLNDLNKVYGLGSAAYYEVPLSLTNGTNNIMFTSLISYSGSTFHNHLQNVKSSRLDDKPTFDSGTIMTSNDLVIKLNDTQVAGTTFYATLTVDDTSGEISDDIKAYYASEDDAKAESNSISTDDNGNIIMKLADVAGEEVWAKIAVDSNDVPTSITSYHTDKTEAESGTNALTATDGVIMFDLGTVFGTQVYAKVESTAGVLNSTVTSYHTAETPTDANKFSTVTGDDNTDSHVIFDLGSKGGKHISVKVPLDIDNTLDTSDADNYEYYFGSDAATANTAAKNGTADNKLETVDDVVVTPGRSELHNGYIIHQMKAGVDIYGVYTNTAANGADPVMGDCKGFYVGKTQAQNDATAGDFGNRINLNGVPLMHYDATNEFLLHDEDMPPIGAMSLNDFSKVYVLDSTEYYEIPLSLTNGTNDIMFTAPISYNGSTFHNQLQNVLLSNADNKPTFDSGTIITSNDLVIKLNDTQVAGTTFYATLTVDDTSGVISDDVKAYYASEDDAKAEENAISTDDNGNIIMKLADVAGEEVWAKIAVDSSDVPTSITSYHTGKTEAESGTNALTATDGVVMIDLGTVFGTQVYAKVESTSGVLNSTVTSYHTAETPTDANKFSTVTGDDNTDSHVIFDLGSRGGKHISVKVPLASDNTLDTSDADNYEYYFGSDAATANTAAKNGTADNKLETVGIEGRSELHNGYIIHQMKEGVDIYGVYTNAAADGADPVMGDCQGFYVGKTQAQNDATAENFGNRININGYSLTHYDATNECLHDGESIGPYAMSLNDLSKIYILWNAAYDEYSLSLTNGTNMPSADSSSVSYGSSMFGSQLQNVLSSNANDKPTFEGGTNNASSNDLFIKLNDSQVAGTTFYATLTVDDTSGIISDDVKAYYASEDDAKAETNALDLTDGDTKLAIKFGTFRGVDVYQKVSISSDGVVSDTVDEGYFAKDGDSYNEIAEDSASGASELYNGYIIHLMKEGSNIYGVYTNTAADGENPVMGDCQGFYVGKTQAQNDVIAGNFINRIKLNGNELTRYDETNEFVYNSGFSGLNLNDLKSYSLGTSDFLTSSDEIVNGINIVTYGGATLYNGSAFHNQLQSIRSSNANDTPTYDPVNYKLKVSDFYDGIWTKVVINDNDDGLVKAVVGEEKKFYSNADCTNEIVVTTDEGDLVYSLGTKDNVNIWATMAIDGDLDAFDAYYAGNESDAKGEVTASPIWTNSEKTEYVVKVADFVYGYGSINDDGIPQYFDAYYNYLENAKSADGRVDANKVFIGTDYYVAPIGRDHVYYARGDYASDSSGKDFDVINTLYKSMGAAKSENATEKSVYQHVYKEDFVAKRNQRMLLEISDLENADSFYMSNVAVTDTNAGLSSVTYGVAVADSSSVASKLFDDVGEMQTAYNYLHNNIPNPFV